MIPEHDCEHPQPLEIVLQVSKLIKFILLPFQIWHQFISLYALSGRPKMECHQVVVATLLFLTLVLFGLG